MATALILDEYLQVTQALYTLMLEEHAYLSACIKSQQALRFEPGQGLSVWMERRRGYLEHLERVQETLAGQTGSWPAQDKTSLQRIEHTLLQMLMLNKENEQLYTSLLLHLYQPHTAPESEIGFTKATVVRSYTAERTPGAPSGWDKRF